MRSLWPHDAFAKQRRSEFSSAAARRAGDTRTGRGLIDDPGHHGALHGTEVHHVPHAPPGAERGAAERLLLTLLPGHDAGAGHVPVADLVVAGIRVDPGRVRLGDDDPVQPRT